MLKQCSLAAAGFAKGSEFRSAGRPILELEVNAANPLQDEMTYQLRMTLVLRVKA